MLVISDLHIGVTRSGGTTLQSAQGLREYLRQGLRQMLTYGDNVVTVNGDLLDNFTIDIVEVIRTYEIFAEWLAEDPGRKLNLIQGNHDANPRGDKLSSFHLLCFFLQSHHKNVRVFDSGFECVGADNIHCIPHMPNQDAFNAEIEKAIAAPIKPGSFLLLHCNYKNTFAENSDHSLNLVDDQVGRLMMAGWTLILAHEHQQSDLRGGRVTVVGNQFPTSVADCIGSKGKRAVRIDGECMTFVETWSPKGEFIEIDWRNLPEPHVLHRFIRVVGNATAAEAAEVVNAIGKFRQACAEDVFVVSNAVKVEGAAEFESMAEVGVEGIKAFDVLGAIMELLDEKEQAKVRELLA